MGGIPMLQNTVVRGNIMGVMTIPAATHPSATSAGQHTFAGRGITGWSALTEAVKMFGPAATTQEFSEKLLK